LDLILVDSDLAFDLPAKILELRLVFLLDFGFRRLVVWLEFRVKGFPLAVDGLQAWHVGFGQELDLTVEVDAGDLGGVWGQKGVEREKAGAGKSCERQGG
jgi:hypothetical protein